MTSPASLTIGGLGPGGEGDVTAATRAAMASAERCFLRTRRHPSAHLAPTTARSFDDLYDRGEHLDAVYREIADVLVAEAIDANGPVVYVVPGSPLVLERSVRLLRADPRVAVTLLPAVSFLDVAYARLGIDPVEESVRLVDGHTFARDAAGERGPLLVAHAHAPWVLSDIKLAIDAGGEQRVVVLQRLGTPEETIFEVAWPDLDRLVVPDHLTSLYLPEVTAPVARELQAGVELVSRLRRDCPWDAEQTHGSLRKYLIEEAYEVLEVLDRIDAIKADTPEADARRADCSIDLEEELGDLWFQILFHAELAAEAGQFTMADVARGMHDKLVSRHPHVFGSVRADDADAVVANWEDIKQAEKGRDSVMDGIPAGLPALSLAEKVLTKAARHGLADAERDALVGTLTMMPPDADGEAVGRHLLAVVEWCRRAGIDPEAALRQVASATRQRLA